jgi:hypothetical protein
LRRIKARLAGMREGGAEGVSMHTPLPRLAALAVAALSLAACATTGLYQARDGQSGYAERRLSATQWRVEFVGDASTGRETVETYLLYRSAELTAENGFEWFVMPARAVSEESEIVVEVEHPDAYRARYWRPKWRRRSRFFWSDVDPTGPMPHERPGAQEPAAWSRAHYSASADIVMGNGPPPVGAFPARETIMRLESLIVRPQG